MPFVVFSSSFFFLVNMLFAFFHYFTAFLGYPMLFFFDKGVCFQLIFARCCSFFQRSIMPLACYVALLVLTFRSVFFVFRSLHFDHDLCYASFF